MSSKLAIHIRLLLAIAMLILITKYLVNNQGTIAYLADSMNSRTYAALSILYLAYITSSSIGLILSHRMLSLKFQQFISCSFINCSSSIIGFFLPSGATGSKLLLLSKYTELSFFDSVSALARITNSFIFTSSIIAFLTSAYFLNQNPHDDALISITTTVIALGIFSLSLSALMILGKRRDIPSPASLANRFWSKLKYIKYDDFSQFSSISGVSLIQTLIFTSILYVYLSAALPLASFLTCAFLVSINNLLMIFPITPGNIGIREGVYFYVAPTLGVDPDILVSISIADRLIQLMLFGVATAIFAIKLPKVNEYESNE